MKRAITAASVALGTSIVKRALNFCLNEDVITLTRTVRNTNSLGAEVRGSDYDKPDQLEKSL